MKMKNKFILFSFLFFLAFFGSCSQKDAPVSPVGIWTYAGGEAAPMSMVFQSDGKLIFRGGFEMFNPVSWHYDEEKQKLLITSPKFHKAVTECSAYLGEEYSCFLYDHKTNSFSCTLTSKTKHLGFLGWYFSRE